MFYNSFTLILSKSAHCVKEPFFNYTLGRWKFTNIECVKYIWKIIPTSSYFGLMWFSEQFENSLKRGDLPLPTKYVCTLGLSLSCSSWFPLEMHLAGKVERRPPKAHSTGLPWQSRPNEKIDIFISTFWRQILNNLDFQQSWMIKIIRTVQALF